MNKLIKLRTASNISEESMADLLKVSKEEYVTYEENPSKIPTSKGRHISQIFGVKMSDIFLP